jgi:hypothetical protein
MVGDTYVERVVGLQTNIGYEVRFWKGLYLAPRLGVGYNHAKPTGVRYTLENNKWEQTANTDKAVNRTNIKGGLNLGYRFNNKFDVGVTGHYALVVPHIPDLESPLFLHKGVNLTLRCVLR